MPRSRDKPGQKGPKQIQSAGVAGVAGILGMLAWLVLSGRPPNAMNTVETNDRPMSASERPERIRLPLGLLGFEQIKDWNWIETETELPFRWLQAVGDPSLMFLIVPPFDVLPWYQPDISDEDVAFLGLQSPEDAEIFCIVTLRRHGKATVNLKGPVVFNRSTRCGKQVVLSNAADYSLQHVLPTAD